jgi:uncharacterized protein
VGRRARAMAEAIGALEPGDHRPGRLADNIMHFARLLRQSGLPVGPGQVLDAIDAAQFGGLANRSDFYWTLHAVLVRRHEHSIIFDQAFEIFWRRPKMIEQLMQLFFQRTRSEAVDRPKQAGQRRVGEAMFQDPGIDERLDPQALEIESIATASAQEVLRSKDFEQMTAEEEAEARRAIARLRRNRLERKTRRFTAARDEVIDMRATLRRSLRAGGAMIEFSRRGRRRREPPLVVLADISGSMANYTRMFLHFLHALKNDRSRMHVFVFGTRLTNITRELERRDVDEALARVAAAVKDWSGGTRIGQSLRDFNFHWGRRVLGQGAHVVIMTDGLERDDPTLLREEMARLARSARRVIWLNPLLRYDGFEPAAAGVRTMMPYTDEFRPVHNLESLEDLAEALSYSARPEHASRRWLG